MPENHDYLGPDGILKGEQIRKAQRANKQERLIRYDRFRITLAISLVVACGFCGFIIFVAEDARRTVRNISTMAPATYRASLIMSALMNESTASIYYSTIPGTPTREETAELEAIQAFTISMIANKGEEGKEDCILCSMIGVAVDIQGMLFTQTRVIRRVLTPLEIFLAYRNHMIAMYEVGSYFLGTAVTNGAATMMWENELIRSLSVLAAFLRGIAPKYTTPELMPRIPNLYNTIANALWEMEVIQRTSYILVDSINPQWSSEFQEAVADVSTSAQDLLDQISVDLTGVSVESTGMTPTEAVEELTRLYSAFLTQLDAEEVFKVSVLLTYLVTEISACFSLGFIFFLVFLLLYAVFRGLFLKGALVAEKFTEERLELSMERMNFLVERILEMDPEGVRFTVDFCNNNGNVTAAERELIVLSQRYISILEFVPSSVIGFRKRLLAKQKAQGDPVCIRMGEPMECGMMLMEGGVQRGNDVEMGQTLGVLSLSHGYGKEGRRITGGGIPDGGNPLRQDFQSLSGVGSRTGFRSSIPSSEQPTLIPPSALLSQSAGTYFQSEMEKTGRSGREPSDGKKGRRGGGRRSEGMATSASRPHVFSSPIGRDEVSSSFGLDELSTFFDGTVDYPSFDKDSDFLPPALASATLSTFVLFVIVDVSWFCAKFDPTHSKILMAKIPEFMSVFLNLVTSFGGRYIGTSGSFIVVGVSEGDIEDSCIQMLMAMTHHLIPVFPDIRCAICGRCVPQRIIGTPHLKVFVTDGGVLIMADLLFRIASLYSATVVIDSFTAVRMDTQTFDKIALERVGLEDDKLHNVMTVYELALRGERVKSNLWNEAFDRFQSGMYIEAEEMILEWKKESGETVRADRFLSNLYERHTVTFLFASEENYDYAFHFA